MENFDGKPISFTLSRPLARINVATTDITELVVASSIPTGVKLSYTTDVYTSYNVLTGEVNADSKLLETASIAALVDATTGDISYDYLFAPSEGGVVDFTATFYKEDGSEYSSYSFANISYKQNHQTNISGSLLGDVLVEYEKTTVSALQACTYPTSNYWLIEDNTIPDNAFYSNGSSTLSVVDRQISIYCPNATSIGDNAFRMCSDLATVDLPEATTIGNYAFNGCSSLATIDIPEATTIGDYAFENCLNITAVDLPEATSIGDNAFYGCSDLATVDLPKATKIGENAFSNCSSLMAVDLPEATTIGNYAFSYCTGLKTMTIATESQVTSWGTNVFSGVTTTNIDLTVGSLNSDDIDAENKTWNGYKFNLITVL